MNSPFQFGKTVTDKSFTDREDRLNQLAANLSGGISTILISPRRWGKSSLVKKCVKDYLETKGKYRVIMLDLFRIRDEDEFLESYAKEILKASGNKIDEILQDAKKFFKVLVPKISISADSLGDFSLSFDTKELRKNRREILDLPETAAQKKKIKLIICVDEFQNISNYKNTVEIQRELRSAWQNHKNVTYCLYGSKRHMMSSLFNDSESPFFRFGEVIFLEKIAKEHWIPFISQAFRQTGKSISPGLAGEVADSMQNHPYYVQQLSHIIWNLTDQSVDDQILKTALNQIISMNAPFFIREYEALSNSQVNLLKAVCDGAFHLNSSKNMTEFRLGTSGNVSKNKRVLEEQDIIDIDATRISFTDPVFYLWFRKHIFLNEED